MAPHSSTLAWKLPWMEEPGRLQSMGLLRVGQDSVTSLSLFTFMHWRRKWQPTPVFLPGESQGRGSLVGCSLWGRTELDTTEATQQQQQQQRILQHTDLSVRVPLLLQGNFLRCSVKEQPMVMPNKWAGKIYINEINFRCILCSSIRHKQKQWFKKEI